METSPERPFSVPKVPFIERSHVCMYVCIYMYLYVCTYACICICMYMHVFSYRKWAREGGGGKIIRREKMVGEASVRWLYGGGGKGSACMQ